MSSFGSRVEIEFTVALFYFSQFEELCLDFSNFIMVYNGELFKGYFKLEKFIIG